MSKLIRLKNFLYEKLFKINDTPQRIALGFGLGIFAGILPGTGPLAALFLALVFRVNRAAALLASLLTNTWMSFATFLLAIKAGSAIFTISWQDLQLEWFILIKHWHWQNLFNVSILRIILPVAAGYFLISFCLGLIAYLAVLIIIKKIRRA
ncbi:MAG: DUF2062 domain-containing protein [Candidatus Omnitrophica bacterium]|nr:DUF2062 domain-containing protein [Candidatus Omnitrophota bacterium]